MADELFVCQILFLLVEQVEWLRHMKLHETSSQNLKPSHFLYPVILSLLFPWLGMHDYCSTYFIWKAKVVEVELGKGTWEYVEVNTSGMQGTLAYRREQGVILTWYLELSQKPVFLYVIKMFQTIKPHRCS